MRLQDKVVVITGGNGSIGAVTARLFAKEGAKIVIADCNIGEDFESLADSIKEANGEAVAIECDVTKKEDIENLFAKTVEIYGKIDVLLNLAGVADYFIAIERTDDEMWDRFVAINQTGVFRCCREALKYFKKQGSGNIINMSAIAGVRGNAGLPYSTTKAAIIGMTKNIAIEYAGTNIRCNALCPGAVYTAMTNPEIYKQKVDWDMFEKVYRYQAPDEEIPAMPAIHQANILLFLASDESYAITGQAIVSDCGKFL